LQALLIVPEFQKQAYRTQDVLNKQYDKTRRYAHPSPIRIVLEKQPQSYCFILQNESGTYTEAVLGIGSIGFCLRPRTFRGLAQTYACRYNRNYSRKGKNLNVTLT
jgi:hypothetical protein